MVSESCKRAIKKLIKYNPNITLDELAKLTNLSISTLIEIKGEAPCDAIDTENLELRDEIKRKMKIELMQFLKDNGHLNAKGTFLERM